MFFNNLTKICEERNIKLTPLLTELKLSKGNISKWRNGTLPTGEILIKLSKRLNCSIDFLLFGADSSSNQSITNRVSGSISGDNIIGSSYNSLVIGNSQEHKLSDEVIEIIKIYESLDVRAKNEMFGIVLKFEKEMKEKESSRKK